ncbi:hypothetical protein Stsp01_65410 [Streptomyces sp. NBRC 13847]|nr:hypothetical protein Stsp01_65410 [Streptomyces sp. NBRC 13847]
MALFTSSAGLILDRDPVDRQKLPALGDRLGPPLELATDHVVYANDPAGFAAVACGFLAAVSAPG